MPSILLVLLAVLSALVTLFVSLFPAGWRGRPGWRGRLGLTAVATASGLLAAPLFGPDGSTSSVLTMAAVLWLPAYLLGFALARRLDGGRPRP